MPTGMYIRTQQYKNNMSLAMMGKKKTPEHCEHISSGQKSLVARLGKTNKTGTKLSEESKKKISLGNLGKKLTEECKRKLSVAHTGKHLSIEHRMKIAESHKGEKGSNWQGGKTSRYLIIRHSVEYRIWREAVFTRDNYTCIWCGIRGGRLNADHIKPFAYYPELRFAIDNGRTLCEPCHKKTNSYLKKVALNEFRKA